MGKQRERLIVLADTTKYSRIDVAELAFDGHLYPIADVIVTDTVPIGGDPNDRIIELIMKSDAFSRDLVNWMATNGSTYPSLTIDIKEGQKHHKIVNASPVNWNGTHVTVIGGRDYDFEAKAMKLLQIRNEELAQKAAERYVREMKIKDPNLSRFEIGLED